MESIRSGIEVFRAQLELPQTLELYMMQRDKLNGLNSATQQLNRQVEAIQLGKRAILKDIADLEVKFNAWKEGLVLKPDSAFFDSSETPF